MYFFMYISIAIIIYVGTFNKDFKEEDINKAMPFIVIVCLVLFALSILSGI